MRTLFSFQLLHILFNAWNEMLNLYFVKKNTISDEMIETETKTIKMSYEVASKNVLILDNILIIIIITLFLLCYTMFVSYL